MVHFRSFPLVIMTVLNVMIILSPADGFIASYRYQGTGLWNDLAVGDLILIKGYEGGYLNDDGDGTLSVNPKYEVESQIWEVEAGYVPNPDDGVLRFKFKNVATNNYWKSGDDPYYCTAGLVIGRGDAATWESNGTFLSSGDDFDYRRVYNAIKNYKTNQCCRAGSASDTTISNGSGCSIMEEKWTFEILYDASYVIIGMILTLVLLLIMNGYFCYSKIKKNARKGKVISFMDDEENIDIIKNEEEKGLI